MSAAARKAILDHLASGPATKADIIRSTGAAPASTQCALDDLLREGRIALDQRPGLGKTFLWRLIPERPIDRLASVGWLNKPPRSPYPAALSADGSRS